MLKDWEFVNKEINIHSSTFLLRTSTTVNINITC